ncbi:MAG: acyl-CoA thioesterase [Acidimicrobiales bacterium]
MDETWLEVARTDDPSCWELPVGLGLTGGKGQLFGGCVVGAAGLLLESVTERPVQWITCQFVAGAAEGDTVRLAADVVVRGHRISQAEVRGTVDGAPQSTVLAALGTRSYPEGSPTRTLPAVPPPDDCPPHTFEVSRGGLDARVDVRVADPEPAARRATSRFWFRFHDTTAGDLASVAIATDFVPLALSTALGHRVFGASLDNTCRFVDRAGGEWLLVEMAVDGVVDGIAHCTAHAWADDGRLLAVATQTCTVAAFG